MLLDAKRSAKTLTNLSYPPSSNAIIVTPPPFVYAIVHMYV